MFFFSAWPGMSMLLVGCYLSVFCLYTHFVPWFRTCLIMFSNGLYTYICVCVPANGLKYFCTCKRHLVGLIVFAFYNAAAKDCRERCWQQWPPTFHVQNTRAIGYHNMPHINPAKQVSSIWRGLLDRPACPSFWQLQVRNYHRSVLVTIQKTLEAFLSRSLGYYVIRSEIW